MIDTGSGTQSCRSLTKALASWLSETAETLCFPILDKAYTLDFRKRWSGGNVPHFDTHHYHFFKWFRGTSTRGPHEFSRAFHASLFIRPGDLVLDLGCGDGFITSRFIAVAAREVHALDLEQDAINQATKRNCRDNIKYVRSNAVKDPFPAPCYDAVVWNGSMGHFTSGETHAVVAKIANSLKDAGVFVGSESLGTEGGDHLQYFDAGVQIAALFLPHFAEVYYTEASYYLEDGFQRRECYWVCSKSPDARRIKESLPRQFNPQHSAPE
jgi:SAM-dependent methyltransferase